jgi:prevent-host-death family protein
VKITTPKIGDIMDETITAAEANRSFSRLLRGVQEGHSYLVTSHGRPVAKLVPADQSDETTRRFRKAAKRALLERLAKQPALNAGAWTRDELYDC